MMDRKQKGVHNTILEIAGGQTFGCSIDESFDLGQCDVPEVIDYIHVMKLFNQNEDLLITLNDLTQIGGEYIEIFHGLLDIYGRPNSRLGDIANRVLSSAENSLMN
jgi:hypothetical protein